ncbi:MAG: hypothetical protein L3J31_05885 [Bacteroidales bacterium]|nr:hypothetical protein [Bacteroidales bacterium]MCF6342320.1 hypothetical protein [Bacteroidales bacterium]
MKKLFILSSLSLFGLLVFGQAQVPSMIRGNGQEMPALAPGTEFYCTPDAFFGQDPISFGAFTSDVMSAFIVSDNFTGISGDITSIDWWGLTLFWNGSNWDICTENPKNFEIIFYQDNAGTPGTVVAIFNALVTGQATGNTLAGHPILKYSTTLPTAVSGLSSGWVSIQGSPQGTCSFLWEESSTGDLLALQNGSNIGTDLAFCLYVSPHIPLSNWAIILGIFLIAAFTVYRIRKRRLA